MKTAESWMLLLIGLMVLVFLANHEVGYAVAMPIFMLLVLCTSHLTWWLSSTDPIALSWIVSVGILVYATYALGKRRTMKKDRFAKTEMILDGLCRAQLVAQGVATVIFFGKCFA